jgi:hypothetical protein
LDFDKSPIVATLTLGSRPKQGLARLWAKREPQEAHCVLSGVPKSVREWTFTLSSELPCWELESQWTPESLERDCKGQNPSAWKVIYIIGKLSKRRCLKWARIAHLDIWNTSYDQKKSWESNWQFDSRPLNVGNQPDFEKFLTRATILLQTSSQSEVWMRSYGAPKFREPQLWEFRTKCHLDVAPMERRKIYYKGEGGGFPQVQAVVSFVSPSCPWFVLTPKMFQLCTNHFVLVLLRSMWVIEACQFFLVPSRSSSTPLYSSKVLRARDRASTPCSFVVFCLGFTFEYLKELGVCHPLMNLI